MKKLNHEILLGTTDMLSIAMCFLIIVFLILFIRGHSAKAAGKVYKDWILFSGLCLVVTSLVFHYVGIPLIISSGFSEGEITLLNIYNRFIRMLGIFFILIWAVVFEIFVMADKIDQWYDRRKIKA